MTFWHIAVKLYKDIYINLRMNCKKLSDHVSFHPVPSLNQTHILSSLVYDQIPAKLTPIFILKQMSSWKWRTMKFLSHSSPNPWNSLQLKHITSSRTLLKECNTLGYTMASHDIGVIQPNMFKLETNFDEWRYRKSHPEGDRIDSLGL